MYRGKASFPWRQRTPLSLIQERKRRRMTRPSIREIKIANLEGLVSVGHRFLANCQNIQEATFENLRRSSSQLGGSCNEWLTTSSAARPLAKAKAKACAPQENENDPEGGCTICRVVPQVIWVLDCFPNIFPITKSKVNITF